MAARAPNQQPLIQKTLSKFGVLQMYSTALLTSSNLDLHFLLPILIGLQKNKNIDRPV
jgi:hypothetical protein